MKLEMKRGYEKERKYNSKEQGSIQVKLPNLMISKFQGNHIDCQRFWSQFENEIDRSETSKISKFDYLKEMLKPKVRSFIDRLPFTTEGFERANSILKPEYGIESEVENAPV